ncbi:hypothetical protein J2X50_000402 [Aminobacter sp. BE322]
MPRVLAITLLALLTTGAVEAREDVRASETSSADLLAAGFRAVANGELLAGRTYRVDRMETRQTSPMAEEFVAQVPSVSRPQAEFVRWLGDRYETYVRLGRGSDEFVCILAQPERCYRAYSSRN